jgi:2-methylaconitate cis-trans-isomerase PrpF
VEVEHPSGRIQLDLVLDLSGSKVGRSTGAKVNGRVKEASLIRTAKPIMDGQVFVCSRHFEG